MTAIQSDLTIEAYLKKCTARELRQEWELAEQALALDIASLCNVETRQEIECLRVRIRFSRAMMQGIQTEARRRVIP